MKKLLSFVLLLTVCAVSSPLLTVGLAAETSEKVFEPDAVVAENTLALPERTSYDENTTVCLSVGGQTRTLALKEYLVGVLAAEMPAGFPVEALKAQAVAARTYTLYKMALYSGEEVLPEGHNGADLCDDPGHCEAFLDLAVEADALWGESAEVYRQRLETAVAETDGMVLVYEDEPIAAVFCAASAEKTESAADVWGRALPYLTSVDSPGGSDCSQYEGTVTLRQSDFRDAVLAIAPEADFSGAPGTWFRDSHRSEAGSVIDVLVGEVRLTGSQVRQAAGLNSANFKVKVDGENLVFTTVGYGHGVGLSQYGARYLAMDGQTYDQILYHYYPGTQLRLEG
ncbi:MAG: stage II sporulation protein D [Clostridia bacterium]|nr:stage II sporulation protein D [Clostridia bacterium]